jgi:hypothetical protein
MEGLTIDEAIKALEWLRSNYGGDARVVFTDDRPVHAIIPGKELRSAVEVWDGEDDDPDFGWCPKWSRRLKRPRGAGDRLPGPNAACRNVSGSGCQAPNAEAAQTKGGSHVPRGCAGQLVSGSHR